MNVVQVFIPQLTGLMILGTIFLLAKELIKGHKLHALGVLIFCCGFIAMMQDLNNFTLVGGYVIEFFKMIGGGLSGQ